MMKLLLQVAVLPFIVLSSLLTIREVNARTKLIESMPLVRRLDGTVADDLIEANVTFQINGDVQVDFRAHMKFSKTEVVHLFVANESMALTEILIYPKNQPKSVYYSAPYIVVSKRDKAVCNYSATIIDGDISSGGGSWIGSVLCPSSVLPDSSTRYSLAAEQTSNDDGVTHHLCFYTVANAHISIPDLMVIDRYKVIGAKY